MPSNKKLLQAAAGNAGESLYVEDVFSTYLYDGTGTANNIVNGIDLSGEGGLVWLKARNTAQQHFQFDTERGTAPYLVSNSTAAQVIDAGYHISSYNANGFSLQGNGTGTNNTSYNYASWTFRKAEKFFDVVTYTGTGSPRTVAHNLGSVPAVIIVKRTNAADNWVVYHSSIGATKYLILNSTGAAVTDSVWNNTSPTATEFSLDNSGIVNQSGSTFVAYLFASDAGGFGDDGSESIIKCGSYTGTGSAGLEVDLGFEPQWVLIKRTDGTGGWPLEDTMRGMSLTSAHYFFANLSAEEQVSSSTPTIYPNATGFTVNSTGSGYNGTGNTYIYIAIRRPMKTPESGTEVFNPIAATTTTPTTSYTVGFPADLLLQGYRTLGISARTTTRMLGDSPYLQTANTTAEASGFGSEWDLQDNYAQAAGVVSGVISWFFKRATGFFDVVAYTGDGTNKVIPHNLGVKPELIITKPRSNPTSSATDWIVYAEPLTNSNFLYLNSSSAAVGAALYPSEPTADNYTVLGGARIGDNGGTNISYLFATLAGVSKVGSYTGTGSNVDVDCGFSAGARFILIKRTDSTGDWYVWDSARGIVAGNDPYLLLNSTAAEVTSTDYIDPLASGFTVTSSAPAALNASGGNYIFLAIA